MTPKAQLGTPRTAAGRALLDMPLHTAGIGSDRNDDMLRDAILAIEAEAAAPEITVEALAQALQHRTLLLATVMRDPTDDEGWRTVARTILAALREKP